MIEAPDHNVAVNALIRRFSQRKQVRAASAASPAEGIVPALLADAVDALISAM